MNFNNGCQCTIPDGGYCERHGIEKSLHFVLLCRTRQDYFRAWEEGRGPRQPKGNAEYPYSQPTKRRARGPGMELYTHFRAWGFFDYAGCGCKGFARQMDQWGCDECERRLESDIVPWIVSQFEKRRANSDARKATGVVAKAIVALTSPEDVPEMARIAVMDAIRKARRAEGVLGCNCDLEPPP